jgi:hypothetical protein
VALDIRLYFGDIVFTMAITRLFTVNEVKALILNGVQNYRSVGKICSIIISVNDKLAQELFSVLLHSPCFEDILKGILSCGKTTYGDLTVHKLLYFLASTNPEIFHQNFSRLFRVLFNFAKNRPVFIRHLLRLRQTIHSRGQTPMDHSCTHLLYSFASLRMFKLYILSERLKPCGVLNLQNSRENCEESSDFLKIFILKLKHLRYIPEFYVLEKIPYSREKISFLKLVNRVLS